MHSEYEGEREMLFIDKAESNRRKARKKAKQTVQCQRYFFLILCVKFSPTGN